MNRNRSAITIIELLVTLISASVVLAGLSTVILQMATDQKHTIASRGQAFDRVRGLGEIAWTLKQAGRRGIRQSETGNSAVRQVDDPNSLVADGGIGVPITGMPPADYPMTIKSRGVITYVLDDFNQFEQQPGAADTPDPARSRTGVIFQHESVVYRFETLMSDFARCGFRPFGPVTEMDPGPLPPGRATMPLSTRSVCGFNGMSSAQLAAFFNNDVLRREAEVLCVGVDRFDVDYRKDVNPAKPPVNPWAVRWEVVFFRSSLY